MDRVMMQGLEWLGYYYGNYHAQVIDNVGFSEGGVPSVPVGGSAAMDKIALLKVRVPDIGDTELTPPRIAYPKAPIAGAGFGFKSMPPKGSMVWVEFEFGNPDVPIWSGGWWAKGEMPSELESVDAHGWFTPGGHKVLFWDDEGQEKVRIQHKLGGYLEWDFQGNVVVENYLPPGTPEGTTTISMGEGATEAAVLGDILKGLLEETLDAITQITVISPVGTTSPPVNLAAFQGIRARLQTALSRTVKVK
jgi:hypothetical protein